MNEEGSRFAPGMMGSEAFAGVRELTALRDLRDADGIAVSEALDAPHAAFPTLPRGRPGFAFEAYVEAHIEQGPVLEAAGATIGVVTGIQGKKTYEVELRGDKGHAGTPAMADRRDALAAFARIASALYTQVGAHDEQVKFTIGQLHVEPNAAPCEVSVRALVDAPGNDFDAALQRCSAASKPLRTGSTCPACVCCRPPATMHVTWRRWRRAR